MKHSPRAIMAFVASVGLGSALGAEPPFRAAWAENMVPWLKDAAHYVVAPDGKPENQGTADSPWDIETVFAAKQKVSPGDVVWLRGGTYGRGGDQVLTCNLAGTRERPIVIRQAPGERATVNAGLQLAGSHTWLWGFELTNTSPHRRGGSTGGTTTGQRPGVDIRGPGSRAVNLVIHDSGHPSPGFWTPVGDGGELHGCILWANGAYPEGTYPAGSMYAQNPEGTRYITDNIAFRNFTIGVFCGSSGQAKIDGFHIEGNVSFDHPQWNIFLHAKGHPMQRNVIVNNYCWSRPEDDHKSSVQLGYWDIDNEDVVVRDNVLVMGTGDGGDREFFLKRWKSLTVTGNTIVGPNWLANFQPSEGPAGARTWDRNVYFGGSAQPFKAAGAATDFEGWKKATGFDAASTWSPGRPAGVRVFVRPNKYEPGRGHVVVFNWDKQPTVDTDVAAVLPKGAAFEVRDAQNYFGKPVLEGVYDGQPLRLPMDLTEVAQPVGEAPHIQARFRHTAPEFAVFVVMARP